MHDLEFYVSEKGECPATEYLDGIQEKDRCKCLKWIQLLEEHGPQLHRPFADYLKDGIYELRTRFKNMQHRFLFFYHGKFIVVTHGFLKKSHAVEEREIEKALDLKKDWLKRYKLKGGGTNEKGKI